MVKDGKPGATPRDSQNPSRRRSLLGWAAALAFLILADGLMATTRQSPTLQGSAKPRSLAAHSDCLKQCHQAHPKAVASLVPTRRGTGALLQGPINSICLGCHQGPPAPAADMGATKLPAWTGSGSSHIDGPFLERSRNFVRMVDRGAGRPTAMTAQCEGCHNVHAKDHASSLAQTAFDTQGRALPAKPATVAQVCFGCHAGPASTRLTQGGADLGALFAKEAASSHAPGATSAAHPELPSLRSGLFTGTLDCGSCHDNSNPDGPRGPHFSAFPHLLKAGYGREGDVAGTGDRANDLCFGCHDKTSILENQSFPLHAQHISGFTGATALKRRPDPSQLPQRPAWAGQLTSGLAAALGQPTPCATCHDPHGSRKSPALIAFDKTVVARSSVGAIDFRSTGPRHGNCTLTCHGYDHVQAGY